MHTRIRGSGLLVVSLLFALCGASDAKDTPWTARSALREQAESRSPIPVPRFSVDLDQEPEERWTHIANQSRFRKLVPKLEDYLESNIPPWALPIITSIGEKIEPYFQDYGTEMKGISSALGLDLGKLVALNLVMQLEHVALNCSNWNDTAPTIPDDPGCMDVDPSQTWCYCHNKSEGALVTLASHRSSNHVEEGPGLCTSVVAEAEDGSIHHGRNLDWNLPSELLPLVVDVDFKRGGKVLFRGTTPLGFVGIINGMSYGEFSTSIDARKKGGKVLVNLLQALLTKSMTPAQHQRKAYEVCAGNGGFECALKYLENGPLIDDVYYVIGGASSNQGAIIARDRNRAAGVWKLDANNHSDADGWYRLETNYDWWQPAPVADNRRQPGYEHMRNLTRAGVPLPKPGGMWQIMSAWPTFNHHTDYTGIFSPEKGTYEGWVWM